MRRLLSACAIVAALLTVAAVVLGCCAHPHRCPAVPEQVLLVPHDKPLMTAQERAWARQSGIGTYVWDGITVVDEGLPESYWHDPWHE